MLGRKRNRYPLSRSCQWIARLTRSFLDVQCTRRRGINPSMFTKCESFRITENSSVKYRTELKKIRKSMFFALSPLIASIFVLLVNLPPRPGFDLR